MNEHWSKRSVVQRLDAVEPVLKVIAGRGYIGGSYAAWLGGGAVAPNDVDVFAVSAEACEAITSDLENLPIYGYAMRNELVYKLPNAVGGLDVQVIKPHPDWKVFPDDILESFDLDICRAVLLDETQILADQNVGLLEGKFLRINNPLRSLKRAMKYHDRRVTFNDHELAKLFQAWDSITPERKAEIIERARLDSQPPSFFEPEYRYDDDYYDAE